MRKALRLLILMPLVVFFIDSCTKDLSTTDYTEYRLSELGRRIFFDTSLSNPGGQACASCHAPANGFTDPSHFAVSPGVVTGLFGNRNAPTIAYAKYTPAMFFDNEDSSWVGGLFLDGRVNSLSEQAGKPFLNPLEMGNTSVEMLVNKFKASTNYGYYMAMFGVISDPKTAFDNITRALAAYENVDSLSPFTSKFDYYLKGQAQLTDLEFRGMQIFKDTAKGKCANCHNIEPDDETGQILFTDFTYINDGVPANPSNPFYTMPSQYNPDGRLYVDKGLGGFLKNPAYYGMFRTSTLRNIALTAPYFHNGVFNTLEEVVHFYNVRDVPGSGIARAEYLPTVDSIETGNLRLTADEETALVAFLKTLTDGYRK